MILEDHKEKVPFAHYVGLFRELDPLEAAERSGIRYDAGTQTFTVRLLYADYEITWPEFSIRCADEGAFALHSLPAQMLLMRYLLEGKKSVGSGAFLPYREMPWGEVYLKPFTGRCLSRAAFTFGPHLNGFEKAIRDLGAIRIQKGDVACQAEIMPGYDVRLIVWEGDDEFPPNSQMLFSDNFPKAFSAEDRTVVGDILISDLKRRMQ